MRPLYTLLLTAALAGAASCTEDTDEDEPECVEPHEAWMEICEAELQAAVEMGCEGCYWVDGPEDCPDYYIDFLQLSECEREVECVDLKYFEECLSAYENHEGIGDCEETCETWETPEICWTHYEQAWDCPDYV